MTDPIDATSPAPSSPATTTPATPTATLEDLAQLRAAQLLLEERLEESDTQLRAVLELLKLRHASTESRLDRIEERLR